MQKSSIVTKSVSALDGWITSNILTFKTFLRVAFGIVWVIDGALKFQPGLIGAFPSIMEGVARGQPSWLSEWFSFWTSLTLSNPVMFVYTEGVVEVALGAALIVGLLAKITYSGGLLLSLLIWAVPEGFGGPYGPASTDIGTGIVYAFGFLLLIALNATSSPNRLSLDSRIEKRWPAWSGLAEFRWTARSEGRSVES